MRTLLPDYPGSQLGLVSYAISMRLAYLLSNQVVYAGKAAELYQIIYKGHSLSLTKKVDALKYRQEADGVGKQEFAVIKKLSRIKHKQAHESSHLHQLQNAFHNYYNVVLQQIDAIFKHNSFLRAEDVWRQPTVFKRLEVNMNPERSDKNTPPYSDWLLLNLEETEGDIIVLPPEFYWCHHFEAIPENEILEETAQAEYIDHCISLPLLGHSTMEEMACIRNYAGNELDAFKRAMNQYIDLFVENEDNINRQQFFVQYVKPNAEAVNKKWQQCPLMSDLERRCKGGAELQVWIGELPVKMIWHFYNEMGVIPPATWKRLQQAASEDERLQGNWPVILVNIETEEHPRDRNKEMPGLEKRRTIKL